MAFPRQGPKEWSPKKIDQILAGLEEQTVDTDLRAAGNQNRLIGVVDVAIDWKLSGFHVTDEPAAVAKALERGEILGSSGPYDCSGLVVSARPKDFKWRSQKKWDFLKTMSEDKRIYLADLLNTWINSSRMNAYITNHEASGASRAVERWLESNEAHQLTLLAQQPYNFDIAGIAERNALAEPFKPYIVTVIFEGRYLENNHETQWWSIPLAAHHLKKPESDIEMGDLCRTWKDLGWDGIFITGRPMDLGDRSGVAQLSIWNPKKILSYGTSQETTRLSGRLSGKDPGEGGTTQAGRRFMSSLSPSTTMAMIQELADRSRMFGPMRKDALEELKETLDRLRMGLDPMPGRFKVDLSKDLPEIVDTEVYRRIRTLTANDVAELLFLVDEILPEMDL